MYTLLKKRSYEEGGRPRIVLILPFTERKPFKKINNKHINRYIHLHFNASLFKMGGTTSKIVDDLLEDTNFDPDEIERLRKRFMKLDRDSSILIILVMSISKNLLLGYRYSLVVVVKMKN